MDRHQFANLVATKIDKYAQSVPEETREDFTQDVWVHLFSAFDEHFAEATPREVRLSLDLVLFRRLNRWMEQARLEAENEPHSGDLTEQAASFSVTVTRIEVEQALAALVKSLEESKYSPEDIQIVLTGLLEEGLTQKAVAAQVGRSPALLWYDLHNFRSAA